MVPLLTRRGLEWRGSLQGRIAAQTTLLPESLDDWVDESDPVRFIDAFVDGLDLRKLGFAGVDPDQLPDNPVKAVTFNKVRAANRVIMPEDLPDWWEKVQALSNPLRRAMHELGLYSGLRPGSLVGLQRSWVRFDDRAIAIPKMKSGRTFDLPLSACMAEIVMRALDTGHVLYPGSPWLFPTLSTKDPGAVIRTQVWREKSLPSETGHILRHTYRTIAQRIGLDKINARLLLDHTVSGIEGVYIHDKALFERLLAAQERMSNEIARLTRQPERTSSVADDHATARR